MTLHDTSQLAKIECNQHLTLHEPQQESNVALAYIHKTYAVYLVPSSMVYHGSVHHSIAYLWKT